ncbi:type II toxin-antitoxin system HicB family antitoxin [Saccharibacillus sp. CPCC 101409]|uniref:type II toxin-antitoxin system HicB family antitoxin n=1 Tax=Saccharibacillus sp. CPCC 101409 TaxID=3058041 RepID=UPI002670DD8A|nr:type II toxin-antitoxin system HicB family antitoxin [Saccharibacillus sp. CPCC 101409]MDO3408287.1 type II toxin-antitoxin system HicB family antitoxin [Saccharibacillus sp. CPCC 101409]
MMKHKGYIGTAAYDKEAQIFHGEVVNTRDVITFQADSLEKLNSAFKDSVDDYLEFCMENEEHSIRSEDGSH